MNTLTQWFATQMLLKSSAGGGGSRLVYDFAVSGAYLTTNIPVSNADIFQFTVKDFVLGGTQYLLGSNPNLGFILVNAGGAINFGGMTLKLDGVLVVANVTMMPTDSDPHVLTATMTDSYSVTTVGASRTGASTFSGKIYDITKENGSVYNYPVDDGWSVNPTIANAGSGADATLTNGVESDWVNL